MLCTRLILEFASDTLTILVQELVSKKDQAPLRMDRGRFEPQLDFVPAPAFAAAFEKSSVFRETRAVLDTPFDKSKAHPAALCKSKYGVPGYEAVKALFWREKILLTADKQSQARCTCRAM